MKKIFSIIAILAFVISFSSCGNKKKKDTVGTHTHEDGTVYANDAHSHDDDAKPAQESFEVEVDNDIEHQHDADEHEHEHDQDNEHGEHK